MTVRVREATEADLPAILAINNDAVEHSTASWELVPGTLADRVAWFESRRRDRCPVLVAVEGEAVLGWASYGPFRSQAGFGATREHAVYVRADSRGRGLGRLLLGRLIDRACDRGIHVLIGALSADNEASLRLHSALGFTEAGRLHQVGRKFGRWLDLVFVELLLPGHRPTADEVQSK